MNIDLSARFVNCLMREPESLTASEMSFVKSEYYKVGCQNVSIWAKEHKVLPFFSHTLMFCNIDIEYWGEIHEHYCVRNAKIVELLDKVFQRFEEEDVGSVCVVENFGVILATNACMGCFCSGDIDLFCLDVDFNKIDRIMGDFGFVWSDRHKRKKSFAREYKSLNAIGEEFWLNFQWKPITRVKTHLFDQRFILRRYKETLCENMISYGNTNIKMLNLESQMYYNCLHIACCHYYIQSPGIRLYVDIDRLTRMSGIDWKKIISWGEKDRLGFRIYAVLYFSKVQMQSPIEENIFDNVNNNKLFMPFIESLIDLESMERKEPKPDRISDTIFAIRTELKSDGTSVFRALIRRLIVLLVDWE